ncbi:MAG: DUF2288 domain-containing protein [Oculatellaceae cyanobacterium Prado106]|jgi:hypothetical protein|nr:DUF2288 domain-containing protein [Oculatellaceae cyanobacterium Prado106]
MSDLRDEMAQLVDEAEWEWLMPHVGRDAVVMVDGELDLVEVGVAIASDNVTTVQQWIAQQQLYKPSPEKVAELSQDTTRRFHALIVQPYVLVQDLTQ